MQSAEDLKLKERARRQRELARLIEPEFRPGKVLVMGDCGLARALRDRQIDAWGLGAQEAEAAGEKWLSAGWTLPARWPARYDLVVVQGEDAPCPEVLPGAQLLFPTGEPEAASVLPAWAGALDAAGLRRDFAWKSWGALSGAALFRPARAGAEEGLAEGYENALDALRLKLERAEQSCRDYQKLTDHQRAELSAAHEHEQQLESALNSVTQSH